MNQKCRMDTETLAPSPLCVLEHCPLDVGKCAVHSDCRSELLCVSKCTAPLAGTGDAPHFLAMQGCIKDHCPGFPPSKQCVATNCALRTAECRQALQCSDECGATGGIAASEDEPGPAHSIS